ncbi:hypothetical protein ACK3TF_004594 [Chlorella vulgaris]
MDNQKLLKLALALVAVFVLYKLSKSWGDKKRLSVAPKSNYVPFDEMPFDTVPPKNPGPILPINVATDLLPKPEAPAVQDFGEYAPNALGGLNFLEVSQQLGVDTQGSSLRNANYQIRSEPPNPRSKSDLLRRPLE